MTDHYTKHRHAWIESVSPFHKQESEVMYYFAWVSSLVFGTKMPHELR